jgi:hypothetical protein
MLCLNYFGRSVNCSLFFLFFTSDLGSSVRFYGVYLPLKYFENIAGLSRNVVWTFRSALPSYHLIQYYSIHKFTAEREAQDNRRPYLQRLAYPRSTLCSTPRHIVTDLQ